MISGFSAKKAVSSRRFSVCARTNQSLTAQALSTRSSVSKLRIASLSYAARHKALSTGMNRKF